MNTSTSSSIGLLSSGVTSTHNITTNFTSAQTTMQPSHIPVTPKALKDATRVIYVIVFIVGVVGNIMVCYIIAKRNNASKRRSIHTFTLNLALADLLVLFIYLPSQLKLFETNMLWKIGDALCRITYLIVPLSIYASIGTLVAISRDRYIAVLRPMASLDKQNTKWILLIIWIVSFALTIPLLLVAKVKCGYCTEIWPNQLMYEVYWIFAFCIQFAIPVLILAIAHILIIAHLKSLETPSAYFSRALARRRQQQHLIRMSISLVLVYVICMLPQHVVFFWIMYGNLKSNSYKMYIFQVSNLMLILNSALNPIVYGTLNNDIKRGILSLFSLGKRQSNIKHNDWRKKTIELQTISSFTGSSAQPKRPNSLTQNGTSPLLNDDADTEPPLTPTAKRYLAIRQHKINEKNGRAKLIRSNSFRNKNNHLLGNNNA
eukprot:gene8218-9096_t